MGGQLHASAKLRDRIRAHYSREFSWQRNAITSSSTILPRARGPVGELSFTGESPDAFAAQLQSALREPSLFQKWKALQPDPDAIDDSLGSNDPTATVVAKQNDLRTDVTVTTTLSHGIIKHRVTLLVGKNWTLRDVTAV